MLGAAHLAGYEERRVVRPDLCMSQPVRRGLIELADATSMTAPQPLIMKIPHHPCHCRGGGGVTKRAPSRRNAASAEAPLPGCRPQ